MGGIKHAIRQRLKSVYVSRDNNDAFVLQITQSKAVATSGAKNDILEGTILYKPANGEVQEESFEAVWNNKKNQYDVVSNSISTEIANQEKIEVTYNGTHYSLYNEHTYADLTLDDTIGIADINLLVCTHGEIGSGFWDEVDMAFIELQKYYGFTLTIERFGESAETQASFLNELADKEDIGYNAMCSTVLTSDIGDALRRLSTRIPTVTYNTSVSSIPDAIEYVGGGLTGEETQGY